MKNRDYKFFGPNQYFHIFNRGVGKMGIYRDDQDYLNFLKRVKLVLGHTRVTLVGKQGSPLLRVRPLPHDAFDMVCYCLMPNHFHFLIKQNSNVSISKFISKVCTSYSMYFNKKYKRIGSLFQDTFKAVLVSSDSYLFWLSAYIHNNPKVAGLVKSTEDWLWGSYQDYLGVRQGSLCNKEMVLNRFQNINEYRKFVEESSEKIKKRKDLESLLLD